MLITEKQLLEFLEMDREIKLIDVYEHLKIHILNDKVDCWCDPVREEIGSGSLYI